jgi:hypothetical protein
MIRSEPTVPNTAEEVCDCFLETFLLATSLQMHIEAHHAEQKHICSYKDCQLNLELYTKWDLNLHKFEAHDGLLFHCLSSLREYNNKCLYKALYIQVFSGR